MTTYTRVRYRAVTKNAIHVVWLYVKAGKDYPKVVIDDITYTREKVVGTGFTSPQGRKLFRSNDHVIW